MRKKAISLFTGQGGLDIGVEAAGFEIVAAIEANPYACETLRQNKLISRMNEKQFHAWFSIVAGQRCYKSWSSKELAQLKARLMQGLNKNTYFQNTSVIEGDIKGVSANGLLSDLKLRKGDLELIIGGPPCQSFSRAGKRLSIQDERGKLFLDFARFVRTFAPRWFIFENVKGILQAKTDIPYIECRACKYVLFPPYASYLDTINTDLQICSSCGKKEANLRIKADVPGGAAEIVVNEFQKLGYTCYTSVLNAVNYGVPQFRERFFIVGSRDNEKYAFPSPTHSGKGGQFSLFDNALSPPKSIWETLFENPNPYHYSKISKDRAVLWVKNVVRPHDEPVTWSLDRPAPTIGSHQSAKLAIAPFGVPQEQLARQQWHTLGKRQGDTPPVHVEHSYLSDEDLLRLQTFPPYWYVAGTRMERAIQIGNSVPPLLASSVASCLTEKLEERIQQPVNKAANAI